MAEYKIVGDLGAVVSGSGALTEGIGFPLRTVDTSATAVSPAFGGIEETVQVALADIDATPQALPANAGSVSAPVAVQQNFATDELVFDREGVWQVHIATGIEFTDTPAARRLSIRLVRVSGTIVVVDNDVAIGRNTGGVNYGATFLIQITAGSVGLPFIVDVVSAADTYTSVFVNTYQFSAVFVA